MNLLRRAGHLGPEPSEMLPLTDRVRYVEALRICFVAVVLVAIAMRPDMSSADEALAATVSAVYLALSTIPSILRRVDVRRVLPVVQGMLLADGIYLAWVTFVTGGAVSPLRFLLFIHVIVVTLLVSYRTGLKLAAWHSLLFLVIVQAHAMGLGAPAVGLARSADGNQLHAALTLAGLWLIAFATATFSAINERELRRQKADLNQLAEMMFAIDGAVSASAISRVVLDALVEAFGFTRGVVLASRSGGLEVLGATAGVSQADVPGAAEPLVEQAWKQREPQLVRGLDPATDPGLAALLPEASNVLMVPLTINHGRRPGIIALEHARARRGMKRWEISMVAQFASHAALALHNTWLTEERETQVREIESLQRELVEHNVSLELTVAERTEDLRTVIRDLEEVDQQRRSLLSHVVRAQEDERTRIANDIHDDPLQKLVATKMRVELLQRAHPEVPELRDLHETVRSCIGSLRFLLFDLRPPILDEEGLGPAIEKFLEQSGDVASYKVRDELLLTIPAETRVILYRIATEALTNARKHAQARHIKVELVGEGGGVLLRVADDGVGFNPADVRASKAGHLGLAAMRERAEMAGGTIDLHSLPGSGTVLEVSLPIDERETVSTISIGETDGSDAGELVRVRMDHSA